MNKYLVKLQLRVLLGAIFKNRKLKIRLSEIGMLEWYHYWRTYRQLAKKYLKLQIWLYTGKIFDFASIKMIDEFQHHIPSKRFLISIVLKIASAFNFMKYRNIFHWRIGNINEQISLDCNENYISSTHFGDSQIQTTPIQCDTIRSKSSINFNSFYMFLLTIELHKWTTYNFSNTD